MSSDYVHMIHAQYYKVAIENLHIGLRTGPEVIAFRGIIEEVQKGITPKPGTGWTNNCNRLGRRRGFSVSVIYSDITFTG